MDWQIYRADWQIVKLFMILQGLIFEMSTFLQLQVSQVQH